jgi:hypothetical protein
MLASVMPMQASLFPSIFDPEIDDPKIDPEIGSGARNNPTFTVE